MGQGGLFTTRQVFTNRRFVAFAIVVIVDAIGALQPVAKVARSLFASLGRILRCRNSLVSQSILLRFDASNPAQCRGTSTRGTFATGCLGRSFGCGGCPDNDAIFRTFGVAQKGSRFDDIFGSDGDTSASRKSVLLYIMGAEVKVLGVFSGFLRERIYWVVNA